MKNPISPGKPNKKSLEARLIRAFLSLVFSITIFLKTLSLDNQVVKALKPMQPRPKKAEAFINIFKSFKIKADASNRTISTTSPEIKTNNINTSFYIFETISVLYRNT